MTVLSHFFPIDGQWSSFFDRGTSPYTPYQWDPTHVSGWKNKGVEIPIQRFGHQSRYPPHHGIDVESSSDSDCEAVDFGPNMNNNSGRLRRKRRQSSTSSHKLISPSDFLLDTDSVEIKAKDLCCKKKQDEKSVAQNSSSETNRTLRKRDRKSEEKIVWIDDSDIENEINETSNYSVYKYLKGFLNSTDRQIDSIKGDGNCFFRALSKVIFGSQAYYREMRKKVIELIEKYPKKFEAFTDSPVPIHIMDMKLDKTWATQTEIYAAATLLNRDIYILSPDQSNDDNYRWLLFSPQFSHTTDLPVCACYLTLCHTHGNHYDRVVAKSGKCNCELDPPELSGITESLDLTNDFEVV